MNDDGLMMEMIVMVMMNMMQLKPLAGLYHLILPPTPEPVPRPLYTAQPTHSPNSQHFQLNFTITNLPYSHNLAQPGTAQNLRNKRGLEDAVRRGAGQGHPSPKQAHLGTRILCGVIQGRLGYSG